MKRVLARILLFMIVALVSLPLEVNAQNGTSGMRRKGSVTRQSRSRGSSSSHRSRSSSRSKPKNKPHSASPVFTINDYFVDTDSEDDDGNKCIAFYIDFNVKNRKNKITYVCVYPYKGDNMTEILDVDEDQMCVYGEYIAPSNNERNVRALLTLPYLELTASSNWDPDVDGITFDIVFENEDEDTLYRLEDILY